MGIEVLVSVSVNTSKKFGIGIEVKMGYCPELNRSEQYAQLWEEY